MKALEDAFKDYIAYLDRSIARLAVGMAGSVAAAFGALATVKTAYAPNVQDMPRRQSTNTGGTPE